jgi:cholesterol transport system auxiliary component
MIRTASMLPVLLVIGLSGCAALRGPEPLRIVAPAPQVAADPEWPAADWTLVVQRPVADKTRGSARIVVRSEHARLAYYPAIAWLDELPEMLQSQLLAAFTDSGRLAGAVRPGTARARFSLTTEVRAFDIVDESGSLSAELEVHAGLLESRTGALVAHHVFRQRAPVAGQGVDALTDAFERALGALIGEVIGWTLATAPPETEDSVGAISRSRSLLIGR